MHPFLSLLLALALASLTAAMPTKPTSTTDVPGSACTSGVPATSQEGDKDGFPIDDYTMVTPASSNMTWYAVGEEWHSGHYVSGPHYIGASHDSAPYAPFKCQWTCNVEERCNSFVASFTNINTEEEPAGCVLYDAVTDSSVFVGSNDTIGGGGFDHLCPSSTST